MNRSSIVCMFLLAFATASTASVSAATMTLVGASAADPLFFGPNTATSTSVTFSVGPNVGQCHVQAAASAATIGAGTNVVCQDPGSASTAAGGPVFYGAVVIVFQADAGCFATGPSLSFVTMHDVEPVGDGAGPGFQVLPSPQGGPLNTVSWLIFATDADLYQMTFSVSQTCGGGASLTWLQRA